MALKILKGLLILVTLVAVGLPLVATMLFRITSFLGTPRDIPDAVKQGKDLLDGGKAMTVVVVTAHPDDSDWYCGGTLSALAERGNRVIVVVGTSGEKGGDRKSLGLIREEEQRKSGRLLGYDVQFLRFPDRGLGESPGFEKSLTERFDRLKPEIVLSFDTSKEGYIYRHSDHEAAGRMAAKVSGRTASVREMYLFHSSAPDTIVDISPFIGNKSEAMELHRSQRSEHDNAYLRFLFSLLGRGRSNTGFYQSFPSAGIKAGELFRRS